jgi:hypothetical protein
MKTTLLAAAVTAAACLFAVPALADEPFTHDGFQLRLALGPSYLSDAQSVSFGSPNTTIAGAGAAFELYLGGSPIRGLTVGGLASLATAINPSVSPGGSSGNGLTLTIGQVGPYIDFYPSPSGGFHALAGPSLGYLSRQQGSSAQNGVGYGLDVGVGYDWWVGPTVSLGVLARFSYVRTAPQSSGFNGENVDVTDNAVCPSLLFSVTYQ